MAGKSEKEKFEEYLEANGSGAFGKIEYNDSGVILRSSILKTPDRGAAVRVYFDGERNQVMTGRRFEVMSSQWLIRRNSFYRIYTNVDLVKPLPKGISARIELTEDGKDVFGIMSFSIEPDGNISYTVLALRSVEIEPMCSFATLIFDGGFPKKRTSKKGTSEKSKKAEDAVSEDLEEGGDESENEDVGSPDIEDSTITNSEEIVEE